MSVEVGLTIKHTASRTGVKYEMLLCYSGQSCTISFQTSSFAINQAINSTLLMYIYLVISSSKFR